jgi:hypothetical protein
MKMKNRYRVPAGRIRSLQDLELEKARLEIELYRSEETIKKSYHDLVHRLTFRNLAGTIVDEVATGTSTLSRAISLGKSFLEKRKKKKKEKARMEEMNPPARQESPNQENPVSQ